METIIIEFNITDCYTEQKKRVMQMYPSESSRVSRSGHCKSNCQSRRTVIIASRKKVNERHGVGNGHSNGGSLLKIMTLSYVFTVGQVPTWMSSCCVHWFMYVIYTLSALTSKSQWGGDQPPPTRLNFNSVILSLILFPFFFFFKEWPSLVPIIQISYPRITGPSLISISIHLALQHLRCGLSIG